MLVNEEKRCFLFSSNENINGPSPFSYLPNQFYFLTFLVPRKVQAAALLEIINVVVEILNKTKT